MESWNPLQIIQALRQRKRTAKQIAAAPCRNGSCWAAARRYHRLQDGRALGAYPVIPYLDGAVLAWPPGASSVAFQARYGLGEPFEQGFCLHALRPGDLFCDVGANAGVYTILASKVAGARVAAFEPVPQTYSLLMQNVWANDVASLVDARQCGVGSHRADLHFTADLWSFNHVVEPGTAGSVEVPVDTLDALLEGRVPFLIKIDVEGFEGEVVAGAERTLRDSRCAAVIMELVTVLENYGTDRERVASQMIDLGFTPHWYDPATREFGPVGPRGPFRYNQLFIRDMELVRDRVASAAAFELNGRTY